MANSNEQEQSQPLTDIPSAHQTPAPSVPTNSFLRFQQRTSAARHRPGYARVPSVSFVGDHESQSAEFANSRNIQRPGLTAPAEGLGIALPESSAEVETIITKPAWQPDASHNIVASPEQATPGPTRPLMSPPSTAGLSGTTTYDSPFAGFDTGYKSMSDPTKQSFVSIQSTQQPSYANSEAGLLYGKFKDKYDSFAPEHHCQSSTNIKGKRFTWLSVTIFVLAIYSTAMSLVFFVLAAKGQRYGEKIRTGGSLTISGATVLTTFFAKTIELSFVTVIVALLGQALARRAYDKDAVGGVTLAEIGMRSWILQPGTLVTHWEGVKYASLSLLGATSLAATILAMLYVTAANALVQPQLKFHAEWRAMQGLVKTSFANPEYVKKQCETPITATIDPVDGGPTCMQLEHAANAFHNYYAYLSTWSAFTKAGNGTGDLRNRPQGYATLNDTTKISGAWIEQEYGNMTELNELYGHVIVNVSLAMPHAGVIGAAKYSENDIMQPEDLDGQGLYRIHASVPSPVIHVTCAMLSKDYLRPVVASLANYTLPKDIDVPALNTSDVYRGGTSLDDIFGWGPSYGDYSWPPVFSKLPLGYNTMVNDTLRIPYGRDSIYLLGNSTIESTPGAIMSDPPVDTFIYPLCQMRVSQTPYCSTSYNASSSGATLAAHCEDEANPLLYINSLSNATSGRGFTSREWPNIAGELFKSLALNDGTVDGNGSNSRVLTQLVPKTPALDPALPSIAEAIAVMAGSTLLQATKDAPFVEFFNYTAPSNIIDPGQKQWFNASIEAQQYASGGTAPYQRGFLLILFAVFFLNLLALIYFVTHRDWYADLSEPSNLFSLAINSPPSKELAGSCGGGPHGKQFRSAWRLQEDGGHVYMESMDRDTSGEDPGLRRRRTFHDGLDILMSPVRKTTAKFSSVPDK